MRKIKIILYLLIMILAGTIVYQNWAYFKIKNSLGLNLKFWTYTSPDISNALFFLGCFLIGCFIVWTATLFGKYKASRTFKELNHTINAQQEKISTLRRELEYHKKAAEAAQAPGRQSVDEDSSGEPVQEGTLVEETPEA